MKLKYETSITLEHEGDIWRVVSVGRVAEGMAFCHLASTTRFKEDLKGRRMPRQIGDWISLAALEVRQ